MSDKTSGSTDLSLSINKYLLKNYSSIKNDDAVIEYLSEQFGAFETVINYLKKCRVKMQEGHQSLKNFLSHYEDVLVEKNKILFENCYKELKNFRKIITISNSKTVQEFLKYFKSKRKNLLVVICESRPKLEGRNLAKALLKEQIKVQLITEAMIPEYASKVDCALISADAILINSNIVNKVGSKLLALTCKSNRKPFYVIADKTKFKNSVKYRQPKQNKNEIWNYNHPNLTIKNHYFEEIPGKLITKIISN